MTYVMADIHGEYKKFKEMLREIEFASDDNMFILGDIVDRGPEPIALLKDLSTRLNIFCLLGNHEYMMSRVLNGPLAEEVTDENIASLTSDDLIAYQEWMDNGGDVTLKQYRQLDDEDREAVLDFIDEMELFEAISIDEQKFILIHAGFSNFDKRRSLDSYAPEELIFERHDYDFEYFNSIYTIAGHTPTLELSGKPEILKFGHNINIDCGATFEGGRLACLCLDTMEEFYV